MFCIGLENKEYHIFNQPVSKEQFEITTRNISAQYAYEPCIPAGEEIRQVFKFVDSPSYVDMAKEMTNFTSQNVITQAANSMLAQANQMPEKVLQLLQ